MTWKHKNSTDFTTGGQRSGRRSFLLRFFKRMIERLNLAGSVDRRIATHSGHEAVELRSILGVNEWRRKTRRDCVCLSPPWSTKRSEWKFGSSQGNEKCLVSGSKHRSSPKMEMKLEEPPSILGQEKKKKNNGETTSIGTSDRLRFGMKRWQSV